MGNGWVVGRRKEEGEIGCLELADCAAAEKLPEVLAPFAFIAPFRTPEEAVGRANAMPGMQSCTVYTADIQRAQPVIGSVHSEICRISSCNDEPVTGSWPEDDDEDGHLRELEIESVYPFTRPKAVWLHAPL